MKTTRRQFARAAAIAAALPLVPSAVAHGQATTPPPPAAPPEEPKASDLAQAQAAIVVAEFGAFLTAEEVSRISRNLHESATFVERLRAVPLANSDEPDSIFAPLGGVK
jgi:hypothetical protein